MRDCKCGAMKNSVDLLGLDLTVELTFFIFWVNGGFTFVFNNGGRHHNCFISAVVCHSVVAQ